MEVLVFGGTLEGRLLVKWLDARGTCDIVACTATDYGAQLLNGGRHVQLVRGPLSDEQKRALMEVHDFVCIVDATHPYATHISRSIDLLSQEHGVPVVRVVREDTDPATGEGWTCVRDMREAAAHVAASTGNVLLTTGSKDLDVFVEAMPDFADRLYVRVLPVVSSIMRAVELGVRTRHVIAMQGPFSTELNCAMVRDLDIRHLVTKRSGDAGGFAQKAEAAHDCGIELVVVARPGCGDAADGLSLEEAQARLEEDYGL